MKIENTQVFGIEAALRGMRNSRNSHDLSDSLFGPQAIATKGFPTFGIQLCPEIPLIGKRDLELCQKLIRAGTEHRKFLRQICIWVDLTLPRYVWTEFDTYKVGTVRNSQSSINGLGKRNLTIEDFEIDDEEDLPDFLVILNRINRLGELYRNARILKETNLYNYVRRIKKLLPESFLQKSTITMNYEVAATIYKQRQSHRLHEWREICKWILSLPLMTQFLDK